MLDMHAVKTSLQKSFLHFPPPNFKMSLQIIVKTNNCTYVGKKWDHYMLYHADVCK